MEKIIKQYGIWFNLLCRPWEYRNVLLFPREIITEKWNSGLLIVILYNTLREKKEKEIKRSLCITLVESMIRSDFACSFSRAFFLLTIALGSRPVMENIWVRKYSLFAKWSGPLKWKMETEGTSAACGTHQHVDWYMARPLMSNSNNYLSYSRGINWKLQLYMT